MRDYKTISFIVPTIGRDSLGKTLTSIHAWRGDEVLVIKHNPPSGNWGNNERQEGTDKAHCDYIAYIDDDNVYVPNHREMMDKAIKENPNRNPIMFKIQYPDGRTLWNRKWVANGNIDTHMFLVPNDKEMMHEWEPTHSWADYQFINRSRWPAKTIDWRDEVIVLMGHNDEKYNQNLNFKEARDKGIIL